MSILEQTKRKKRKAFFSGKFGSIYDRITGNSIELLGNLKGDVAIRKMKPRDEDETKNMIRDVLLEFGGIGIDSIYFSEDLDYLAETYSRIGSRIMVALKNGQIIGAAAIKPFRCASGQLVEGICELSQLYVKSEFRGQQLGSKLLNRIFAEAQEIGYQACHASASKVFRNFEMVLRFNGFEDSELNVQFCEEQMFNRQLLKKF